MVSSVLGKRTRSSTAAAATAENSRAKRQATTTIYNDENDSTFVSKQTRTRALKVESSDIENSDAATIKSPPAKHGAGPARTVLLPTQIKKHFNTVKVGTDENVKQTAIPTPQTPRHRDALSKKAPVTPRHRVTVAPISFTPKTPRTPSTPSGSSTIYNVARQLFTRSNDPGRLVGREEERTELLNFLSKSIETISGGCTYVSGPPGTGKSAMVHEVMESIAESTTVKKAYVNCMSMKTSKDIYTTLLDSLCPEAETLEGEEIHTLQNVFAASKGDATIYLVTLDEIDHVLTLDLEVLYKLFEWSLQLSSRLVLVGIANALDLTDRFLPRLKARNLKPHLLPFLPYTAPQIKAVIITRLKSLVPADSQTPDFIPFLHPAAIELCSRKVAQQSGDLRKAFDICRRVIDMIESETKQKVQQEQLLVSPSKKPLGENLNLSSPPMASLPKALADSLARLTIETAPRASIAHLNKVTTVAFGNGATQRLKTLNLQQKAALCALVALEKKKRAAAANVMATPSKLMNAAPTVKALYDTYCMLCKRDSVLHPLTSTEFRDVIGSLETLSLVNGVDGKNGSFVIPNTPSKRGRKGGFGSGVGSGDEKRVGSCVGERELEQAVSGVVGEGILRSILSGEGLE